MEAVFAAESSCLLVAVASDPSHSTVDASPLTGATTSFWRLQSGQLRAQTQVMGDTQVPGYCLWAVVCWALSPSSHHHQLILCSPSRKHNTPLDLLLKSVYRDN